MVERAYPEEYIRKINATKLNKKEMGSHVVEYGVYAISINPLLVLLVAGIIPFSIGILVGFLIASKSK